MRNACHLLPAALLIACGSSGPATVHVALDAKPGWNGTAELLVSGADGTIASRAPLTAAADVTVDPGGAVTVALRRPNDLYLMTATSLASGDHLTAHAFPDIADEHLQTTSLTLPTVSGADEWVVAAPGSLTLGNPPGLTIDLDPALTRTPILARASSGPDTLALYGGRQVAIDTTAHAIDLTTSSLAFTSTALHVTGAPASGASYAADLYVGTDDVPMILPDAAAVLPVPTGFADHTLVSAVSDDTTTHVQTYVGSMYGTVPSSVSLDLAAPALPALSNIAYKDGTVSWHADGGGDYDLIAATLRAGSGYEHQIAAPPGATSVALPKLPADLAPPSAFDSGSIQVVERSDLDGYDAALDPASPLADGAQFAERFVPVPFASASVAARPVRRKLDARAPFAALGR
jgi:hypothetical protein